MLFLLSTAILDILSMLRDVEERFPRFMDPIAMLGCHARLNVGPQNEYHEYNNFPNMRICLLSAAPLRLLQSHVAH